jgi:hypothetical protein
VESNWLKPFPRITAPRRAFLKGAAGVALASSSLSRVAKQQSRIPEKPAKAVRWQTHDVAKIPSGYQVAVADVNGDSRPDILALSSHQNIVEWYENPSWKVHPITAMTQNNISLAPLILDVPGFHGLAGVALATDFFLDDSMKGGIIWWAEPCAHPGDSDEEVGSAHHTAPANAVWHLSQVGRIPTAHRVRWADLEGNGQLNLVVAPLLGAGAKPPNYQVSAPLSWIDFHRDQRDAWTWQAPRLIDDSLTVVHAINILDWDGDGRDEILTASFEGVHLFHSTGLGEHLHWTKTQLAVGDQTIRTPVLGTPGARRGSSEISVGSVGGHRFLATIEPWHGEHVAVYTRDEQASSTKLWERHVIDSSFIDGHALVCADLDGDGNDEIVAGYRGAGTSLHVYYCADLLGKTWERQTLDTGMAAAGVVIADMNADHRLDVVAIGASTGNVRWYENLG